jgi:hypothetical protein
VRLGVTRTDGGEIASAASGALGLVGGPFGVGCGEDGGEGDGEVRGPWPVQGLPGASVKSFAARFV